MREINAKLNKVIGAPKHVMVLGKKMSADIFFMPEIAESILYWKANSLSMMLHGELVTGYEVIADSNHVSGCRVIDRKDSPINDEGKLTLPKAAGFLITCEAANMILTPSRKDRDHDFSELILNFRDSVRANFKDGEILTPDHYKLNAVFAKDVALPSRVMSNQPGMRNKGI